ncbi:MAG: hypothetical protein ACRC3H_06675 [Lachnospiraceae bacterium]
MTTDTARQYYDYTGTGFLTKPITADEISTGMLYQSLKIGFPQTAILHQESIKGVWFNRKKGITVVRWRDNTVTKVKCQNGDKFNPEHGLAMCIANKAFGNKGNYNDVFKKGITNIL